MWLYSVTVVSILSLLTLMSQGIEPQPSRPTEEIRSDSTSAPLPEDKPTCGYEACPKSLPGKLNVHLVPHTHDDVGWLKTVDEYYYGSKNYIQKAGVQYILDSVLRELLHDQQKKFIYVETAFFWKWWIKLDDWTRHQVKQVVNNGQLEFIGGGWSMNDEAVTHYQSIIDQFTWGFRKLNDTFGKCGHPHIGWQIDPFGHSRGMAAIFAELGFDGLLFGRLDYQDKLNRLTKKTAEMIWEGSPNLGKSADLFTSVLYNNYSPPPGFCYDILCADEPFIDNKKSIDYNVPRLVEEFIKYAKKQAQNYTTNNIIITMGEDFNYQDARMWYKNLDKLIRYVNEEQQKSNSTVNVFYSTPSCYIKAVHDAQKSWTTKSDDFFPYASDPHAYWTGFFTSRPTLKRFERMGNNFLQVCKQLYSLTDLGPEDWVDLNIMREAMGVLQHHDAVTGTEKQVVAFDYARILYKGFEECELIAQTAINKIIAPKTKLQEETEIPTANLLPMKMCLLLNISQCDVSEKSSSFVVTVYNPLSRPVSKYIRFPVTGHSYTVEDPTGKNLKVQMVPIPEPVTKIPGRISEATMELVFLAENLPPLGFRSYYVSKSNHLYRSRQYRASHDRDIVMGSSKFRIHLDGHTGKLKSMKMNGVHFPIGQDFYYYKGSLGDNSNFSRRASGAYIFRPNGTQAIKISTYSKTVNYKGDLVDETHIRHSDWLSQVWRFYKNDLYNVELEWLVGPIPINDTVGKEIINRFESDLKSGGLFYTDTNGRETLERKRDFRPTWKVNLQEPIAGNYYPVTSKIAIKDTKMNIEFAVLTDRSQGGSSLKDGHMELMIHRRLLDDDAFGVGEPLNETAYGKGLVAIGKHWITGGRLGTNGTAAAVEHDLVSQITLSPWLFFTPADNITYKQWAKKYKMEFTGLTTKLPKNVQILTLEPWKARTFLLRLEHIYEKNEDAVYSKPATVKLQNLFAPFSIVSARETTLGANQWLNETKRFQWKTESNEIDSNLENVDMEDESTSSSSSSSEEEDHNDPFTVTLTPMQIRTFVIDIKDARLSHPSYDGDMVMQE